MLVRRCFAAISVVALFMVGIQFASATPRKVHTVFLGAPKRVPYSKSGDPSGANEGESQLKIRALLVDGLVKEWTTGEVHDVTDRSFLVRRALRLNDALPNDKPGPARETWVWQRGPWLMIDRVSGHVTALKLPDYDPGVSQVSWFRDYGAYCGLTASGKNVYAVVAQLAAHRPLLAKKLTAFEPMSAANPPCAAPQWQRDPLRITFQPAGHDAVSFDLVPGSAVLVEESDDESNPADAKPN
jgi:hypothetical protein